MLFFIQPWLSALLAMTAAWASPQKETKGLPAWVTWLFAVPVGMMVTALATGYSGPPDDLLRHLSAWELGFDYRAQYPWSVIPAVSMWVGYEWLLGLMQKAGATKAQLLIALPALSTALTVWLTYLLITRATPKHRAQPVVVLALGALVLCGTVERAMLARPEMFLTLLGLSAWLCVKRKHALIWVATYLAVIPVYWLGWVYAPFILLAKGFPMRTRLALAVTLGTLQLAFWHWYTGDYVATMVWLKGTLSVLATENKPMVLMLSAPSGWLSLLLISGVLALRFRGTKSADLSLLKRSQLWPVGIVLGWLTLPDQIRYHPAFIMVALPWLARTLTALWQVHGKTLHGLIPAAIVAATFLATASLPAPKAEALPKTAFSKEARVLSEQPFATVLYSPVGISVEPSFAFGATKPEWRGLFKAGKLDCSLVTAAGFTHVLEKSIEGAPPPCLRLTELIGHYRLWEVAP